MQLSGVREIGSNVLKNTRETSLWEDLFSIWPVGHRVHEKNSCGRANQTSSPPVMSKSVNGSKSSNGSIRKGYGATRHKVSCHTTVKRGGQHRISYMTSHTISYTTSYTISYTIWHTISYTTSYTISYTIWICPAHWDFHWDFWSRNKRLANFQWEVRRGRPSCTISYTISYANIVYDIVYIYDIVYDIICNVVYDIVHDIVYDIVYDMNSTCDLNILCSYIYRIRCRT